MMFNTIEDAKDFLNSAEEETLGAVVFIDTDGEQMSIPFKEFVNKVGIEKAAQFLFDNQEQMSKVTIGKEETKELMNRFMEDPDSLTEEEKVQAYMVLSSFQEKDSPYSKSIEFYEFLTKFFLMDDNTMFSTYNGLLALTLTYVETALVASSNLSQFADNKTAMNEIVRDVTSQIVIPEGIDEASLLLGLIHVIGNKFIKKDSVLNSLPVNYERLINVMGLSKAFMYECPSCKDGDCSTCDKKGTEDINDYNAMHKNKTSIVEEMIDELKGPVAESLAKNGRINSDEIFDSIINETLGIKKPNISDKETNKSTPKSADVIDIRERLKRN